jgi:hypothetical protein
MPVSYTNSPRSNVPGLKVFSVWYFNKNGSSKWITVYSETEEKAKAEVKALPDFYKLDSIEEDS